VKTHHHPCGAAKLVPCTTGLAVGVPSAVLAEQEEERQRAHQGDGGAHGVLWYPGRGEATEGQGLRSGRRWRRRQMWRRRSLRWGRTERLGVNFPPLKIILPLFERALDGRYAPAGPGEGGRWITVKLGRWMIAAYR